MQVLPIDPPPAGPAGAFDMSRCFADALDVYRRNFGVLFAAAFLSQLLSVLTLTLLLGPLCGGWARMCLAAHARPDRKIDLGLLLSAGDRFVPLVLVALLGITSEVVGLAFLVLPGLFLITAWLFSFPLVVDRNLSAVAALRTSYQIVVRRGFGPNLMLGSLIMLLNVLPMFLTWVGAIIGLFTIPLGWLLLTAAYTQQVRERNLDLGDLLPRGFEVGPARQ